MSVRTNQYLSASIAALAKTRKEIAKRSLFDLGGCGEKCIDSDCLYLMAWAMMVTGKEDLIPYLTDMGVNGTDNVCGQTESIAFGSSGLFTQWPGWHGPLVSAAGFTAPSPGFPANIISVDSSKINDFMIARWNAARAAIAPKTIEFIIGTTREDGWIMAPRVGNGYCSHPQFMQWEVEVVRNKLEMPGLNNGVDPYVTHVFATERLDLNGDVFQPGDHLKFKFSRPAEEVVDAQAIVP